MRKNPMAWEDAQAEGVLSPLERDPLAFESTPNLLGLSELLEKSGKGAGLNALEGASVAVHGIFDEIGTGLEACISENRASRIDVDHLSQSDLDALIDALGAGEVTILLQRGEGDEGEAQIVETSLPGVWLGRASAADGSFKATWLEVADAPLALRKLAMERPRHQIDINTLEAPRGAMNVMGVLAEIDERSRSWTPGTETHVMNFTLFPMSAADAAFLASTLGEVGVQVMSGGYGVARVVMTGVSHVWAVQYLNGMGTTILDTVEIGDVPSCVLASTEDFEDSLVRLNDIQGAYRS